jgi:hypothetical protein
MTDLLTQLRNYGSHLDVVTTESPSAVFEPTESTSSDIVEFGLRSHPVARRQFLRWSAAVAVAAGVGGTALITRRRRAVPAEESGRPQAFVSGPTDTPLGEWVLLDSSSPALTVPAGGRGADSGSSRSGSSNSLGIARLTSLSGELVGIGSRVLDGKSSAFMLTSPDGVAWQGRIIESPNWSMGADIVEFPTGNFVVGGWTGTGDETSQPVIWAGPSLDQLTPTLLEVPSGSWVTAGFAQVGDRLVVQVEDVDAAGEVQHWRSVDGSTWTMIDDDLPDGAGAAVVRPATSAGVIVGAIAPERDSVMIRSSDRGQTWSSSDLPGELKNGVHVIEGTPSGFVVFGSEGTSDAQASRTNFGDWTVQGTARLISWTSSDGERWNRHPVIGETEGTLEQWGGVARGLAGFVALAVVVSDGQFVSVELSSTDGASWDSRKVEVPLAPTLVALANGYLAIAEPPLDLNSASYLPDVGPQDLTVWFRRDR